MSSELLRLIASGESETLAFTKSLAEAETATRTAVAMLNSTRGGIILFGVRNDDGRPDPWATWMLSHQIETDWDELGHWPCPNLS